MIMETLLKDRSTGSNIIWATDSYVEDGLEPHQPIQIPHVTDGETILIQSRVNKDQEVQKGRTKGKAEVFTPIWIVDKMVSAVEDEFEDMNLEEYVSKTWLEITCGEGPYLTSRYDTVTGEPIKLRDRVGFVDRKLRRVSEEVHDERKWVEMTTLAYQSSYGYEFQGDSLFLARGNMLLTFVEFYINKFSKLPDMTTVDTIANIISYNVFQMDGLKYIVPFSDEDSEGEYAIIKDWENDCVIKFRSLLEGEDDDE